MLESLAAGLAGWFSFSVVVALVKNHRLSVRRKRYMFYAEDGSGNLFYTDTPAIDDPLPSPPPGFRYPLDSHGLGGCPGGGCRCGVGSPHGASPFHRRPWCD